MLIDWLLIGIGMGAGIGGGLVFIQIDPFIGFVLLGMVVVGWIGLWRLEQHYKRCLEDAQKG